MRYIQLKIAKLAVLAGSISGLVWFMWPNATGWNFSWWPFWTMISGTTAFLVAEWSESKKIVLSNSIDKMICERDIQLVTDFRELLPSDGRTMRFFREHDLGHSFDSEVLVDSEIFLENWQLAERSFQDKELELSKQKLIEKIRAFRIVLGPNVGPSPGGGGWLCVVPPNYSDFEIPEHFQKAIENLNQIGNEFTQLHQVFTMLCSEKLTQREKVLTKLSI